ncbi:hypothetical protein TSAR_004139 [Trichomalopsis sarcophagae]|uniref:Uncharacterized protein n=1 Tax=Trichomalopsis sarcophagae TaxID=543379 RepID=A0A232FAS7_9HYME|nr:hypothetical protein TSAR_004139 [Trichomalopsis sarcophagae]
MKNCNQPYGWTYMPHTTAFALLSTLLPALQKSDVATTRVLHQRRPDGAQSNNTIAANSAMRRGVLPSIVVNLVNPSQVREIMRAKCTLANNYLTTNDINPGTLDPEAAVCLTGHEVYLNEILSQENSRCSKNLRPIAQGLGFKYVWHAGGSWQVPG